MAILQSTSITGSLEVTGSVETTSHLSVGGSGSFYDSNFYIGTNVGSNPSPGFNSRFEFGTGYHNYLDSSLIIRPAGSAESFNNNYWSYFKNTGYDTYILAGNYHNGLYFGKVYSNGSISSTWGKFSGNSGHFGLGTTSPQERLHVVGNTTITGSNNLTGTYALKVADSNNNSILAVENDGNTKVYRNLIQENTTNFVNEGIIFKSAGGTYIGRLGMGLEGTAPYLGYLNFPHSANISLGNTSHSLTIRGGTTGMWSIGASIAPMYNSTSAGAANISAGHLGSFGFYTIGTTSHMPVMKQHNRENNDNYGVKLIYQSASVEYDGITLDRYGDVNIANGSLHVSGNLKIDGIVTGSLTVASSGSTVLDIQGSQGQLFSVVDSFSGSLFKVATVSGAPVIEAFSDNTVNIGAFNNEAIVVSGSHTTLKDTVVSGSVVVSGSINGNLIYQGTQPSANFTSVGISTSNQVLAAGGINIYNNVGVGHNPFIGFKSDGTNIQVWSSTTIANFGGVGGSTGTVFNLSGGFFNPPSGTSNKHYFTITPSIARGASYSGNVYGLYIAPSFNPADSGSGEFYSAFFGGGNVGVNTTTPSARLHIKAPNNLDDNYALKVTDNSDNDILTVENNGSVRINGELQVGDPTSTGFKLPTTDGTSGQVLQTDGSGSLSFATPSSGGGGIKSAQITNSGYVTNTGWRVWTIAGGHGALTARNSLWPAPFDGTIVKVSAYMQNSTDISLGYKISATINENMGNDSSWTNYQAFTNSVGDSTFVWTPTTNNTFSAGDTICFGFKTPSGPLQLTTVFYFEYS